MPPAPPAPRVRTGELCGERKRYRLLDIDLLLRKLACGRDREQFRDWYKASLDRMAECRAELRREPWWSKARVVGERKFVARQIDNRYPGDIVEQEDGICALA